MSESSDAYKGLVMLWAAPIDKYCAAAVLERAIEVRGLPVVQFWQDTKCSPEQMAEWEDAGHFPIDIGDEKYHTLDGVLSATRYVADMFGMTSPGIAEVVDLTVRNNTRGIGGFLRGGYRAIGMSVRELPEIEGYDPNEIHLRAVEVAHAFIDGIDGLLNPNRTEEGLLSTLLDLVNETRYPDAKKLCKEPFTPGRYLWDLWRAGAPVEEIEEKVLWWIDGWKVVKKHMDAADAEFAAMDKEPLTFVVTGPKGKRVTCLKLSTSNRMLAKRAGHDDSFALRVVKDPETGQAVIASQRQQLGAITYYLNHIEPGLWYWASGAIINGGPQYKETPGTRYSLDELAEIVRTHLFAA